MALQTKACPKRRPRGEQGMAMLLVLMLIILVTAAGVFAAQSTAMEVRSAGFVRQAAQTHYVAESGVVASMDRFSLYCSAYLQQMRVAAASTPAAAGLAEPPLQYTFRPEEFDATVGDRKSVV